MGKAIAQQMGLAEDSTKAAPASTVTGLQGLLDVVQADEEMMARAEEWCHANGASSVEELLEVLDDELLDGLLDCLNLKRVPEKKLKKKLAELTCGRVAGLNPADLMS